MGLGDSLNARGRPVRDPVGIPEGGSRGGTPADPEPILKGAPTSRRGATHSTWQPHPPQSVVVELLLRRLLPALLRTLAGSVVLVRLAEKLLVRLAERLPLRRREQEDRQKEAKPAVP